MFEEGQSYAPVRTTTDGRATVELGADHPGLHDPGYRARRDLLATLAHRWQPGEPVPEAPYTDAEHEVWQRCGRPSDVRGAAGEVLVALLDAGGRGAPPLTLAP